MTVTMRDLKEDLKVYNYQKERAELFKEENQKLFLQIRDRVKYLIRQAGCARMDKIIEKSTGSSWTMLACVDRLVELGEIVEIPGTDQFGQSRIFTQWAE